MLINLTDVLSCEEKVVKRTVETELRSSYISLGSFPLTEEKPLALILTNLGDDKLLIEGEFSVKAQIPCDRCLTEVEVPIDVSFEKEVDMKQSAEGNRRSGRNRFYQWIQPGHSKTGVRRASGQLAHEDSV